MNEYFTLLEGTAEFFFVRLVFLPLLLFAVVAMSLKFPQGLPRSLSHWLLLTSPFAIPFIIIAWGTIMEYDESVPNISSWYDKVIIIPILGQLALSTLTIRKLKGCRLFTLSIGLLQLWCSCCAAFIASMAITGDWL